MLVNLQPYAKSMNLEVRLGDERHPAGVALDNANMQEDMRASRRTLAGLSASGLFSLRREIFFELEFHFPSREDWTEFVGRPRAGGFEADHELLDSAHSRGDGRIVAIEEVVAGAYERGS